MGFLTFRTFHCRFFIFGLLLFLLHQMGIGMFRFIAGLARDDKIASTGGSFFFLSILVLGGFLLSGGVHFPTLSDVHLVKG